MLRYFRATLLLLLLTTPPVYTWHASTPTQNARQQELLAEVERRNRSLRSKTESLSREIKALRDDDRYLEKVARQELGWISDGETVYRFAGATP